MSSIPVEFDPDPITSLSNPDAQMYRAELSSKDPMQSVLKDNPEIYFVPPKRRSEWGEWEFKPGSYYDTTIGSKHPYWKNEDLPKATKDIKRLRFDMLKWGYCKIDSALSDHQVANIRQRVLDQAEAERHELGTASAYESSQVAGLGQLIDAALHSDRVVNFG